MLFSRKRHLIGTLFALLLMAHMTIPAAVMAATTPNYAIIPDSELVNSPSARSFDGTKLILSSPGLIRDYSETVSRRKMSSTESLAFVSTNMSVHPRLLLALLEYKSR